MAKKKVIGDCKKSFKFNNGVKAPIVLKDKEGFDPGIGVWKSACSVPSLENELLKISPSTDKEYRVLKGFNNEGNVRYLLQETIK